MSWTQAGRVGYAEVFDSSRRLSLAVRREGKRAGPGFDEFRFASGQQWDLVANTPRARRTSCGGRP